MKTRTPRVLFVSSWSNDPRVRGNYLSPPMGLHRMRQWLEPAYETEVLDANLTDPVAYLTALPAVDVLGFSPTKENMGNDIALMRFARRQFPNAVIVLGGVEATCNYQQLLDLNIADYIVMGEGEKAMQYLLEQRTALALPPSTIAKRLSYDTVLTREEFTRATELDFTRIPVRAYWERNLAVTGGDLLTTNCVSLYITNYCPQGCRFCSTTRFIRQACPAGAKVITVAPERLVAIIAKVLRDVPDTKTIFFHDDNACHDRQATEAWCRLAIKQGLDVSYVATSRIDHYQPDLLKLMKQAGFRKLACGVEAYSDELLRKIGKQQTCADIDAFLARTRALDLPVQINVMLCQPEATRDDVKRTAEFCLRVLAQDTRNTIAAWPFVKAYAGSWYYDNWELIEYTQLEIPAIAGTTGGRIRVPVRFLPRDPAVRELLFRIDHALETEEVFARKRAASYLATQLSEALCTFVLDNA
jgi:radical SAM superfamily enzyme YgiQ (UPF0313 family)